MRYSSVITVLLLTVFSYSPIVDGVEYLVTDTSGNVVNNLTPLDLGSNPQAKTIQLWLTYNDTERTAANANGGGLMGGAARFTSANSYAAAILPPAASAVTNPGNKWSDVVVQFNTPTAPQPSNIMQASFTRGSSAGLVLDPTVSGVGRILLLELLITPGSQISTAGTQFTIVSPSNAPFNYGSSTDLKYFGPPPVGSGVGTQPINYTFTVVPEPTTYALGAVATAMLGGVGFYRRKKAVKSL